MGTIDLAPTECSSSTDSDLQYKICEEANDEKWRHLKKEVALHLNRNSDLKSNEYEVAYANFGYYRVWVYVFDKSKITEDLIFEIVHLLIKLDYGYVTLNNEDGNGWVINIYKDGVVEYDFLALDCSFFRSLRERLLCSHGREF